MASINAGKSYLKGASYTNILMQIKTAFTCYKHLKKVLYIINMYYKYVSTTK